MLSTVEQSLVHKIRPHLLCIPKEEKKISSQTHNTAGNILAAGYYVHIAQQKKFPFSTMVEYRTVVPKVIGSRFGFDSYPSPYKFDICESLLEKFNFYRKMSTRLRESFFKTLVLWSCVICSGCRTFP
jgi:hypothetical protein